MNWEPWTDYYKAGDGCTYCYYYGPYSKRHGQNTVQKTVEFDKPVAQIAELVCVLGWRYRHDKRPQFYNHYGTQSKGVRNLKNVIKQNG